MYGSALLCVSSGAALNCDVPAQWFPFHSSRALESGRGANRTRCPSWEVKDSKMRCGYASDNVPTALLSPMSCRVTCGPADGASYPSRWRHEASKPSFNRADGEGDTADAPAGWDAAALDCTAAVVTGRRHDLNMETMTSSTHHIVEAEVGGGTVGQVRDDQSIGLAAVLVHHHDVRNPVIPTRLHQLWQHLQPWNIIRMNHT